MQLTYRGVSYDYNPPTVELASTSSQEHDWRFRNHHNSVTLQPNANLTWRGVKYDNNPTSDDAIKEKSRWLILRRQQKQIDRADSMSLRLAEELGLG
ncbi:unknown [Crocosphaera subtropica ATCC 51142]|uniref:DUF4278 domain-containing protein n=1 Tax=Crocosphaera subtropica (strain ATCC 51142 / BH68) TaxID=43989 RepID=B1WT64_CROS5|nr:DUF4278 domain-containing protein [Crocosphaera subtropica]ACB51986.1 unknown [Crocosphaera subtropica ATCC 51142]